MGRTVMRYSEAFKRQVLEELECSNARNGSFRNFV